MMICGSYLRWHIVFNIMKTILSDLCGLEENMVKFGMAQISMLLHYTGRQSFSLESEFDHS